MSPEDLENELIRVRRQHNASFAAAMTALRNYEREPTAERLAVFEEARRALIVPEWLQHAILEATL